MKRMWPLIEIIILSTTHLTVKPWKEYDLTYSVSESKPIEYEYIQSSKAYLMPTKFTNTS